MDFSFRNQTIFIFQFCSKNFKSIRTIQKRKLAFLIILLFPVQCSTFWQYRKKDFLDIISIEVHTQSYGIGTRISFLQMGAYYESPEGKTIGIKSSAVGNLKQNKFSILFLGSESFEGLNFKEIPQIEKKIKKMKEKENYTNISPSTQMYLKEKIYVQNQNTNIQARNKVYQIYFPFGTTLPLKQTNPAFKKKKHFAPSHVYTDFQIFLGLYYGFTIGINFGEFIDFFAGFFSFDIFHDDQ